MARARNIKPALFKNELLGVADPLLTILFQSLWCLADRAGRLEDRPLRIKAETFPYREGLDVNVYLTELHRMGFIYRYEVAGVMLIQIANFAKHQNPHKTEKPSDLPEMPSESMGCTSTVKDTLKHGACRADSLLLIPDPLNLIPDSGNLIPEKTNVERRDAPRDNDPVPSIFDYWKKVMDSPNSKLDKKRIDKIRAALKMGYTPRQLCEAIRGCSLTPHNMGTNTTNTKYNGIELIFRTADHIDRFILGSAGKATAAAGETIEQTNARVMAEFLADGDAHAADDLNTIDMEQFENEE